MSGPTDKVWDPTYEPTAEELEEPVVVPDHVADMTLDEAAAALMGFKPEWATADNWPPKWPE